MELRGIGIIVAIAITVACTAAVKGRIQRNEDFDGMLWGLLVGATTGIIWSVIFYQQVGRELDLLALRQEKGKMQKATKKVIGIKRDVRNGLIIGTVVGFVFWFVIGFVTA